MKKLCNLANSRFLLLELWNTIWHSYRVYKELKPQHLKSIKTRIVNNNNIFYPPFYNDQVILTTNKEPKITQLPMIPLHKREKSFLSNMYLPPRFIFVHYKKSKQYN